MSMNSFINQINQIIMNEKQLDLVKKDIQKFYVMFSKIIEHWENSTNHFTTLGVLVQNASFHSPESYGYVHEDAVTKLLKIKDILKAMADYYDSCHVTRLAYNEISDAIRMASVEFEDLES